MNDENSHESQVSSQPTSASASKCPHLKKGIKIAKLKKAAFGLISKKQECHTCVKIAKNGKSTSKTSLISPVGSVDDLSETGPDELDMNLYNANLNNDLTACLSCAVVHCSANHVHTHATNKSHHISMNLTTFAVWCHECNADLVLGPMMNQLALEAVRVFQKWIVNTQPTIAIPTTPGADLDQSFSFTPTMLRKASLFSKPLKKIVTLPGLCNLGNTCFFNSTLQTLAYNKLLQSLFPSQSSNNPMVSYPVQYSDHTPISEQLRDFLVSMRRGMSPEVRGPLNPEALLGSLAAKWEEYGSYDQQDAHELLRRLLDAIQDEQLPRDENGKITDFHKETFVDHVFGGKLVSIIICDRCKSINYNLENFMDLSIPIIKTSERKGSVLNYLASLVVNNRSRSPSPASFVRTRSNSIGTGLSLDIKETDSASSASEGIPSDDEDVPKQRARAPSISRGLEFLRMGYSPRKPSISISTTLPENQIPSPDPVNALKSPMMKLSPVAIESPLSFGVTPSASPAPMDALPTATLDDVKQKRVDTLLKDMDGAESGASSPEISRSRPSGVLLGRCLAQFMSVDVLDGENLWACDQCYEIQYGELPPSPHSHKASSIPEPSEPDSEVQPNDTASSPVEPEIKTTPSEPIKVFPTKEPRKPILSKAFKRYLVFSAPRTLVIQLKRFEQVGNGMKKSQTHVQFDEFIELDSFMAPPNINLTGKGAYVSLEALVHPPTPPSERNVHHELLTPIRNVRTSTVSMDKVPLERVHGGRYKLFGIVVHSGSINGGHYFSYIKVSTAWTKNITGSNPNLASQVNLGASSTNALGISASLNASGSFNRNMRPSVTSPVEEDDWIYCSDSEVRPASVDEVFRAQAYMLFYERVESDQITI